MKSGVPADKNSPENIIDFYNTRLFADQLKGMFAETIVLVEVATEFFALPIYLRRIGFSLAEHGVEIINCRGKDSIPLFWRLFNAYGYNCYFIFDDDGKTTENTRIFKGIITIDTRETAAEKYVKTSQYAYFGVDFEKYYPVNITKYTSLEQQIAKRYHKTSKPGKAKAIAQHCEEIPDFITELKKELKIIEILG